MKLENEREMGKRERGERKAWKGKWALDNFSDRAHLDKDMKELKGKQLWNKEWEWYNICDQWWSSTALWWRSRQGVPSATWERWSNLANRLRHRDTCRLKKQRDGWNDRLC